MIEGTLDAIAAWAKATIEAVDDSNKVWEYARRIRTSEQLVEDFGIEESGVPLLNEDRLVITRGWMIDVASFELVDRPAMGKGGVYEATVNYIFIQSAEARGANKTFVNLHATAVANALQAESKPAALVPYTTSKTEITEPVSISQIVTGEFPIGSGRQHYRVDMTQIVRLSQPIRS